MSAYAFNGKQISHDQEGFLTDIRDWTPDLAGLIAKGEAIEMTPAHWEVVNFLRDYYGEYQIAPAARILAKEMTKKYGKEKGDAKYLDGLFPGGAAKQGCKIAGLPKPTGCV